MITLSLLICDSRFRFSFFLIFRRQASNTKISNSKHSLRFIRRLFYFCPRMKKFFAFLIVATILACNSNPSLIKAEDAQDAGREFIRASLDGDYEKAQFYLLKDSINLMLIEQQRKNYQQLSSHEKKEYKDASIRPIEIKNENDSITTYRYFNTSNPADTTTMRIVKTNGEWLVDLKSIIKM